MDAVELVHLPTNQRVKRANYSKDLPRKICLEESMSVNDIKSEKVGDSA